MEAYRKTGSRTQPPVSLEGQLLWREYFYYYSYCTPNFDRMVDNTNCKQIPWDRNHELISAWENSKTGYPFIDAIMAQLRTEGWIHHLARHAVACFLTRGDLWQHWEEGARVFEKYLLDADWALNNANWQWLSCSNFFYQYFRCYSPVAFGKKTDNNGDFIRKYVPQLAKFPAKFIYEPWKAPLSIQKSCGCIIGIDYPKRVVIHESVSKSNMDKMKAAYATNVKKSHRLDIEQPQEKVMNSNSDKGSGKRKRIEK
jgi:cryptochrome